MYLPMSMLVLAAAVAIADVRSGGRATAIVAAITVSIVLASWTHERNSIWADPLEFQRDIATKSPGKARAQHNFALALYEVGRSEEALPVIRRTIELNEEDALPLKVLGDILVDLGRPEEAVATYRRAIGMDPTDVRIVLGLGAVLMTLGEDEAAFREYLGSGVELGRSGHPWEAITILKEAVNIRLVDAEARSALGSAYLTAGFTEQALEQFREAIQLDPETVAAWFNMGLAADALGGRDEALRGYRGFVERAPIELLQPIARARARIEALSQDATGP
jgi:superkiller protein 3